jgi:redox-sensitive bicupin YhaK (pirin superfamily)
MPQLSPRGVHGLQLWVNLSARDKTRAPAYRGATASEVPVVPTGSGSVRVLAGSWGGARGPVVGVAGSPAYLDISLEPGATIELDIPKGRTAFFYVLGGSVTTGARARAGQSPGKAGREGGTCVLLGDGDAARMEAGPEGARFVVAHAPPLHEPIAWGGPIVMNTRAELEQAFAELDAGTFIKSR